MTHAASPAGPRAPSLHVVGRTAALVVLMLSSGCAAWPQTNTLRYLPRADAPALEPRAAGCTVDVLEDGAPPPSQPHQVIGAIELEWSAEQARGQGQEGAFRSMRDATCARGAHYVLRVKAYPRGQQGGFVYVGDVAVLVHDGVPLTLVAPTSDVVSASPAR